MKKIILFDTSQGTQNIGDFIIMESINKQIKSMFEQDFIAHYPTHTPLLHTYQLIRNNEIKRACNSADYKFICGTNLFAHDLFHITLGWNINILEAKNYIGSISMGVGSVPTNKRINAYTKAVYRKVLDSEKIHSVRDERTKEFLEKLGLKAINTGCPTIWMLTENFCKEIKREKSENVVFTLTDYKKDEKKDQMILDILLEKYKKVYFWPQGYGDYEYIRKMQNSDKVVIVPPNLEEYDRILSNKELELDYVGTRLHAGIYAMQHKRRSIIINVDNRAKDMSKTYGIPIIERREISNLSDYIDEKFITNVKLNEDNIKKWKEQFRK